MGKTRMPGPNDVDAHGMVKVQVINKRGDKEVVRRCAADVRELIYSDSGTMEIEEEVRAVEEGKAAKQELLAELSFDELRSICKRHEMNYVGKRPSDLRRMILQRPDIDLFQDDEE